MMRCAKSQALTYGLRCTMAQQKPGTIKKNSESGLCQGKQWPHQQQRLCNCCSATFHSTELRQKCTPRILHSPEELKHVLFGTKMIALFWGANGVLQAYAKQVELLQSLWCDTKEVYLAVCQV